MIEDDRLRAEAHDSPRQEAAGRGVRRGVVALGGGAALFVLASAAFDLGWLSDRGEPAEQGAAQQAMQQVQQEASGVESDKAQTAAQKSQIQADIRVATAEFDKREAQFEAMQAKFEAHVAKINAGFAQREAAANTPDEGASGEDAA